MKTRTWVIIFAAVAVLSVVFYFLMPRGTGDAVGIYQNGELLYAVDLSAVKEDYEIVLENDGQKNVVVVSEGSIWVKEATCPDGVCVDHGPLEERATPIVCLPNRVVIKYLESDSDIDGVAGVAG